MKKWYVLYVNVRHEKKVVERLHDLNLEAYVPLQKMYKKWSDRTKVIEEPLFTGYVFVKLTDAEIDKPLYIKGVLNYLKFSGLRAEVKEEEIDGLRFFASNGYEMQLLDNKFKVGSKVELLLSQFREVSATIDDMCDDFVVVTFEGLHQNIKLKAPIGAIKSVS